ncbi:flagellin [Aureimonas sp. AU4]|uniref:flagellin N-terminal helical domain-containing protein n=1 Tax=Aureimonas sp. AU4 TaxID=1638163 RepID=UPI000785C552|nr:flagellin [Aureimonas sp. AU4]
MTSVNFNNAAVSALRNLQSTNTQLDATQNRISTGLKIGEAKDNAAYWSISTTMKSDNKALSTVSDALGLGAATVDTAYQGLNATLDILNDLKSKLTAASGNGVDKGAVQSEIAQLQSQLKSIASSATFSGENWLSVNTSVTGYNATKSVVSGMNRDTSGNVTLNSISIDSSSFVLLDGSTTSEGILDAGKAGNTLSGGLAALTTPAVGAGAPGTSTQGTAYLYTASTSGDYNAAAETLQIGFTIDGTKTFSFTLTGASKFSTADALVASINGQIGSAGVASKDGSGQIVITSASEGTTSTVDLTTATFVGTGTSVSTLAGFSATAGATTETSAPGSASAATTTMAQAFGATVITLDSNDTITFSISANGNAAKAVSIDRDLVNAALGNSANGKIANAADYATVIQKALDTNGVAGMKVDTNTGAIRLTSLVAGSKSAINISSVAAEKGQSILTMDVTTASVDKLTTYLNAVSDAISKVTSAASTLGAVSSRIDLQKTFVTKMMDTIDKGVSGLVDADMNVESTKLQALQVKQQLGVQALSIANQSAQNVLSLFRS